MIPVRNVYYMLAYAFSELRTSGYANLGAEDFDDASELLAEIISRGTASLLRDGLGRDYVTRTEAIGTVRGKLELAETLRMAPTRRAAVCTFDEYTEDSTMNRVLKATIVLLLRSDVSPSRKMALRRLLPHLSAVGDVDPKEVTWHFLYGPHNRVYRMLMFVCRLVIEGSVQSPDGTNRRMDDFLDKQGIPALYEKFLLGYFRREHAYLNAAPRHVVWAVDDGFDLMLPDMRTDITLAEGDRVLIIDAKYYGENTGKYRGHRSIISGNLYQIFAYVKNWETSHEERQDVSGMLLYAGTDEAEQPKYSYQMSGNRIDVRALDLDRDFSEIRDDLDGIAAEFFPKQVIGQS